MQTCIQTTPMPKDRDYDKTVLSLRLTSSEAVRFWRVMDAVKDRNPYVGKSDVFRELLGLSSPHALTEHEIAFFRTGEKSGSNRIRVTPENIPLIKNNKDLKRRESASDKKTKRVA
jgi:hypothetical protein